MDSELEGVHDSNQVDVDDVHARLSWNRVGVRMPEVSQRDVHKDLLESYLTFKNHHRISSATPYSRVRDDNVDTLVRGSGLRGLEHPQLVFPRARVCLHEAD